MFREISLLLSVAGAGIEPLPNPVWRAWFMDLFPVSGICLQLVSLSDFVPIDWDEPLIIDSSSLLYCSGDNDALDFWDTAMAVDKGRETVSCVENASSTRYAVTKYVVGKNTVEGSNDKQTTFRL